MTSVLFIKTRLNKLFSQKAVGSTTTTTAQFLPSTTFFSTGIPTYRNLSEQLYLLKCYYENPVVNAIINIKADAFSNILFSVKDFKTGEITPLQEYEKDKGKLYDLLSQPNPLQSTYEWLQQSRVYFEVFGNAYAYASVPVAYEKDFTYLIIDAINNIPPYRLAPVLTGKWLSATSKDEIIEKYKFSGINGRDEYFPTNTIFHSNNTNIKLDGNFTEGQSDLLALQKPISNIDVAYESRNVLIRKRGPIGMLSSEKKDETMGSLPMNDGELKEVQDSFKKYGTLDDQFSYLLSPMPLKYTKMGMGPKDLMLFEEIESDAIAIAVAFGVPESLVRYYVKKGSLGTENNTDEKRFYDSTIIPEAKAFMIGLNNFLKTKSLGIELIGSFDHLKVLQKNQKEEAETIKVKEEVALSAFKHGAVTYNDYLAAIGLAVDDDVGKLKVWDLTPQRLQAIGITVNNGKNDKE